MRAYVGTYTRGGRSQGIYVFDVEASSGALRLQHTVPEVDPSFLAFHPSGRFLYSVSEGFGLDGGEVVSFAHDALRALRPGGRVTVVDFGGPAPDAEDAHHPGHGHGPAHILRHLPRLVGSRVARSPAVARNLDDGIVALLIDAGFGDAREVEHVDHRFGRVTVVQATRP